MREKFIDYLRHEKRYSAHTLAAYQSDLSQLVAYLEEAFELDNLDEVTPSLLRSWISSLMQEGVSARSIGRKCSAARAYYRWMMKYHGRSDNPAAMLTLPKVSKRLPTYVEEEQMDLLKPEGIWPDSHEGLRDRTIIELLYHTGMRSAELIGLSKSAVDYQASTIRVTGKRNKQRVVPVSCHILELLASYERTRDALPVIKSPTMFFLTQSGSKLYPKLVYRMVNYYLGRVSSLSKKSPHVLRHTFATHMLNRGADLNAIKELLGHASLAATQVYTHNSIEQLKEVHRKAHPKG